MDTNLDDLRQGEMFLGDEGDGAAEAG
jgi:hypothetical protein